MKTKLPDSIKTIEDAKRLIKSLFDNGEGFHPEDDAHDIIWGEGTTMSKKEGDKLNVLTEQMYSIEGNDISAHRYGRGFDPCAYYMELIDERKLFFAEVNREGVKMTICDNVVDETLLTLNINEGAHDYKAMQTAGLNPENDGDVFLYANHLLGDRFTDYDFEHSLAN